MAQSKNFVFANNAKTKCPRAQRYITSINKLDHCGHFEHKMKFIAPSEAEIQKCPYMVKGRGPVKIPQPARVCPTLPDAQGLPESRFHS